MKINKITVLALISFYGAGSLFAMEVEDFRDQAEARAVLGVEYGADPHDIRKAFYANAKSWWFSNEKNSAGALNNIKQIVQAYDFLSSDEELDGLADFHDKFDLNRAFNLNENLHYFVSNHFKFVNFIKALKNKIELVERDPEVISSAEQGHERRSALTRATASLQTKRPWKLFGITLGFVVSAAQKSPQGNDSGKQFEPYWKNIFKASTIGVFTPLAIYFSLKNYNWLYAKYVHLMFK